MSTINNQDRFPSLYQNRSQENLKELVNTVYKQLEENNYLKTYTQIFSQKFYQYVTLVKEQPDTQHFKYRNEFRSLLNNYYKNNEQSDTHTLLYESMLNLLDNGISHLKQEEEERKDNSALKHFTNLLHTDNDDGISYEHYCKYLDCFNTVVQKYAVSSQNDNKQPIHIIFEDLKIF